MSEETCLVKILKCKNVSSQTHLIKKRKKYASEYIFGSTILCMLLNVCQTEETWCLL